MLQETLHYFGSTGAVLVAYGPFDVGSSSTPSAGKQQTTRGRPDDVMSTMSDTLLWALIARRQ